MIGSHDILFIFIFEVICICNMCINALVILLACGSKISSSFTTPLPSLSFFDSMEKPRNMLLSTEEESYFSK